MTTKITIAVLVTLHAVHLINGKHYVGAVVEYSPTWDTSKTDQENVLTNANEYKNLVISAKAKSASIIVFPEYGLTTRDLPEALDNVSFFIPIFGNPTPRGDHQDEVLEILSSVAKESGIYVVVNLIEKNNSSNKIVYYNTNVVFDRSGGIVARYRKINLNNEDRLTPGTESKTFRADFGVTFGILISDDILYKNPANDILDTKATDVVYSTAWYSERPTLTAISIQDGYSKASGVNLLASGLSNPSKKLTGSGVYFANATIGDLIIATASLTNTIVKDIPIISQRRPDSVCDNNVKPSPRGIGSVPDISGVETSAENFKHYTFENLNGDGKQRVCSKDFCCNFDVSGNYTEGYYKLGAFSGARTYNKNTIGVKACVLVACAKNDGASCEVVKIGSDLPVQFQQISIDVNFTGASETFYQPSTLTGALRPVTGYSFCRNGSLVRMVQTHPQDSILSFGIFGRVYDYDGRQEGEIGNESEQPNSAHWLLGDLFAGLLLTCIFRFIVFDLGMIV